MRVLSGSGTGGLAGGRQRPLGAGAPMHLRGADELAEEWVRPSGARPQFGMELPCYEERVVGQLDDLGEASVVGVAREHEPGLLEPLVVGGVHLPAMAVAFVDH